MRSYTPALCSIGLCWIVMIALGLTPAHAKVEKVCLCHVPPGNPGDPHTICVGQPAVPAHLRHGDTPGACPVACSGSWETTCPAGEFCKHDEGACASDAAGVCTDDPAACPAALAPVCGCDGITYPNVCSADATGVTVDHTGACQTLN